MNDSDFTHTDYIVRRKFWQFLGATIFIELPEGQPLMQAKLKAFKLREDIRFHPPGNQGVELLRIGARQIIDFSPTFDVFDSMHNKQLGALRRRGFKSMVQDEWEILGGDGKLLALVKEDSLLLGLIRRLLTSLVPQSYHILSADGSIVYGEIHQNFNPLTIKLRVHFEPALSKIMDQKLALAAVVMLASIEGRQS